MDSNDQSNPLQAKATLSDFIEMHSKLVTSMAAFIALTAFSSQLGDSSIKPLFASATFFGALLLGFELFTKLPSAPLHWRLQAFSAVLLMLLSFMGLYWLYKFQAVWMPLLAVALELLLFVALSGLLTHVFSRATKLVTARWFHHEIPADALLHISQVAFVSFMALILIALVWGAAKLGNRQITIHIPWASH